MNEQQQQREPFSEVKDTGNLIFAAANCLGSFVEAVTRVPGTWGERHAGMQMVFGWLFCLCYAPLFYPHRPSVPLMQFWFYGTLLLVLHNLRGHWLRRRGWEQHSRYTGQPWLTAILGVNEISAKSYWEPALVVFTGVILAGYDEPFAMYLIISGVALGFSNEAQKMADDARKRQMKDARIEQEYLYRRD